MQMNRLDKTVIVFVEKVGLSIIALATIIAFGTEVISMLAVGAVTLADLLLLFIYLEVLAMITMYLDSGKLPIRMPLYIAIVALARYMILDMKNMDVWQMLAISASMLLIASTILIHRYGSIRYPYNDQAKS